MTRRRLRAAPAALSPAGALRLRRVTLAFVLALYGGLGFVVVAAAFGGVGQ